jgi:hypothetical protein
MELVNRRARFSTKKDLPQRGVVVKSAVQGKENTGVGRISGSDQVPKNLAVEASTIGRRKHKSWQDPWL